MRKAADGDSSIHRTADGRGWEGWVSFGVTLDGKRRRRHVRAQTKTAVAEKIRKLEAERDGGVMAGKGSTVSDWLSYWIELRSEKVRPSTVSGYRTDQLHIDAAIGRLRLQDLEVEHIEVLYRKILKSGCTAGSVLHVRRTLSAALNAAVDRRHLARNPVKLAQVPDYDPEEIEPFDDEEIGRVLATSLDQPNGPRWSIAFLGLRQGEVLGLRWKDIDLDAGTLKVQRTLVWLKWQHGCVAEGSAPTCGSKGGYCPKRHGGGPSFGKPKSAAGKRTIVIPDPVIEELRDHRRRQAAAKLAAGPKWADQDLVFPNTRGGPIDRTTDTESWIRLLESAGVRRIKLHGARHSAATAMLVMGISERVLMGTMGWTSVSLVKRYTHLVPELQRDVAARQAALWAPRPAARRSLPG